MSAIGSAARAARRPGPGRVPARRVWRAWTAHRPAAVGAGVLLTLALACSVGPWLSPHDAIQSNMTARYLPPSRLHPMGTDGLGRDLLTRALYGGRISLAVGLCATGLGLGLGTGLGALAGLQGGWVEAVIMRGADALLALPRIIVLILATVLLRQWNPAWLPAGGGLGGIVLALGLLSWMGVARQVRSQLLALKAGDFVLAARALGVSEGGILRRHLLPNAWTPVIVAATLRVGRAIMAESGLSFLGFGMQPPTPTWGNMLTHGQDELLNGRYWLALFPGLMIFLTVIAVNFLGDGLRDVWDPRQAARRGRSGGL